MSNFLAVDTSSRYLTVVAQKGDEVAINHVEDCAMQHSVVLMAEVEKTLKKVDLAPAECDFFAAVTGPGSFTGIRIGISCIKGFACALGKRAVGVTVFEMLSYNVNSDCDYLIAVDAAHGNYYACGFSAAGEENIAPFYASGEELAAMGKPIFGFEDLPFPVYTKLSVKDCLLGAAQRKGQEGGELKALYVRKSQAEQEREARLGGV